MRMGTPRIEQGQIVEYSYGWHDGEYYMRVYDRSDRTTQWYRADARSTRRLASTSYDAGGADYPPRVSEWSPVPDPVEESADD
jgi:hypothetical protein